ncbi:MAG: hypothetical protein ACE5DP_01090 [Fidelibacterota bacterium]
MMIKIKPARNILLLLVLSLVWLDVSYGNYAFYRQVKNTCKTYRISARDDDMAFTKNDSGGTVFDLTLTSRLRNNFQMVMVVGFIAAGQAIKHQQYLKETMGNYRPVFPDEVVVTVTIPAGRNATIISARANRDLILRLANGEISTEDFMREIKNTIEIM